MAILFSCECGKKISVPDAMAGKRGKCPGCGEVVTIPAGVPTPPPAVPPVTPLTGPLPPGQSEIDVFAPDPEVAARPPRTIACPFCAEQILASVPTCPLCNETLGGGRRAAPVVRRRRAPRSRTVDAGAVIAQTFRVYFGNFVTFNLITGIVMLPVIVYVAIGFGMVLDGPATGMEARMMYFLLGMVGLSLLLEPVAVGSVVYGVFQHVRGEHASFGDCLSVGMSRLLPVLGVSLLSALAIVVGMLALCVGAVIVATIFYVAVPVAVVEKEGVFASFGRSNWLTQGNRWGIFAVLFVLYLIDQGSDKILEIALQTPGNPASAKGYLVATMIASVFITALKATASSLYYYHLRLVKEGLDAEDLASVFD